MTNHERRTGALGCRRRRLPVGPRTGTSSIRKRGVWRIPERELVCSATPPGSTSSSTDAALQWSIALPKTALEPWVSTSPQLRRRRPSTSTRHRRDTRVRAAKPSPSPILRSTWCSATTARCRSCDPHRTVPEVARLSDGRLRSHTPRRGLHHLNPNRTSHRARNALLRDAPRRLRRGHRRFPPSVRRVDPTVPRARTRGRGPRGAPGSEARDEHVRMGSSMGASMARRADLETVEAIGP